jgi:hypothetical protein
MKITQKTMMVTLENTVTIGNNNAIELTLVHQAFISRDKLSGIECDIELMDYTDIKFLGMDIDNGFNGFRDFKAKMLDLGINVDKLIDEKATALFEDMNMEKNLVFLFRDQI